MRRRRHRPSTHVRPEIAGSDAHRLTGSLRSGIRAGFRRPTMAAIPLLAILATVGIGLRSAAAEDEEAVAVAAPANDAEAEADAANAGDPSPEGAADSAWPFEEIDMAGLQEAFRILRERYIRRERLTPLELNRAALQGILDRLEFGADLELDEPEAPVAAEPAVDAGTEDAGNEADASTTGVFAAQMLAHGFAYLRPGNFSADELPRFDEALERFNAEGATALILDLRAPVPHGAFEMAAALADRFLPENAPIFRIVRPGEERPRVFVSREPARWTGRTVVLVDREAGNIAETLAAVLRRERAAFIVGSPTQGRTVEYQRVAIGEGLFLRLAVAEMILPDGASLFQSGVAPDFTVDYDEEEAHRFLCREHPDINTFVFEAQRPRLNEAALVAGTNPELPYLIERSAGRPTAVDEPPDVDRVLQRAVDLLVADGFLRQE